MQKVSKQSLAMLALSILLAISIALTFTFAALADKKTATGTISFTGNVALLVGATGSETGADYSFDIADATDENSVNTALAGVSFKLSDTSQAAYVRVTAEVQLNGNTTGAVELSAKTASGFTAAGLVQTYGDTNAEKMEVGTTTTLGALFECSGFDTSKLVADENGAIPDIKVVFTIEADTKSDFTQVAAI